MISGVAFINLRIFVAVALALGCLFVFVTVGWYLLKERSINPHWRWVAGNRAALSILLFMFGETLNRAWGAVLTVAFSLGYDIGSIESKYPVAFVGAIIAFLGILAKLRIFTPDHWGEWLWIGGGLVALVLAAAAVFI